MYRNQGLDWFWIECWSNDSFACLEIYCCIRFLWLRPRLYYLSV